ncbi:GNAT family N-acetyltransferase [Sphingomonas nostoxanthinifaciens]|uniref:GNAT family N-acetyltransferase n=1 Tax=Sphingomonas nostoxanthinifaciens TaxID=2872652 RepID=UPI001CC21370|nr:GNAT family N-acetyltransferase [Sphingomonas nostoxanthinifaciens]UAK23938.1 GNAT family N-acetyltransferase [Sphingomonas nostoxanthinifaciens]
MLTIRPANACRDAEAVAEIYAHHVLHGTGTFEEVPPDAADMAQRMAKVIDRGWPWLLAEDEGGISGYAYAAQFRDRSAYRFSCENSIYIRHDAIGRGVGRALLSALMDAATAAGFMRMYAVIGDAANAGSIELHRRMGFDDAGTLGSIGYKFDRWLDVVFMQKTLS